MKNDLSSLSTYFRQCPTYTFNTLLSQLKLMLKLISKTFAPISNLMHTWPRPPNLIGHWELNFMHDLVLPSTLHHNCCNSCKEGFCWTALTFAFFLTAVLWTEARLIHAYKYTHIPMHMYRIDRPGWLHRDQLLLFEYWYQRCKPPRLLDCCFFKKPSKSWAWWCTPMGVGNRGRLMSVRSRPAWST